MSVPSETSDTFLLKLLSGVHYGVEVGLSERSYSFGSGEDADIRLTDSALLPVHGSIRLRGGKIDLRSEGGTIGTSSGLAIAADDREWHEIAQLDVITAGTSRMALGGRGANWGSLSATTDQVAPAAADRPGSALLDRLSAIPRPFAALALVALMTTAGAVAWGLGAGGGGKEAAGLAMDARQIDALVHSMTFADNLRVSEQVDGTVTVEGHVGTAAERRALNNALDDIGVPVRRRIWVREAISREIDALVLSQQLDVTHQLSPDGHVTLMGQVMDPDEADRLVVLVRDEIFGVTGVEDGITTAVDHLQEARRILADVRLAEQVLLRLDGPLIEASGVVTQEQIDGWSGFVQVYARRLADRIPLRSFVTLGVVETIEEPVIIGTPINPAAGRILRLDPAEGPIGSDTSMLFPAPGTRMSARTVVNPADDAAGAARTESDENQAAAETTGPAAAAPRGPAGLQDILKGGVPPADGRAENALPASPGPAAAVRGQSVPSEGAALPQAGSLDGMGALFSGRVVAPPLEPGVEDHVARIARLDPELAGMLRELIARGDPGPDELLVLLQRAGGSVRIESDGAGGTRPVFQLPGVAQAITRDELSQAVQSYVASLPPTGVTEDPPLGAVVQQAGNTGPVGEQVVISDRPVILQPDAAVSIMTRSPAELSDASQALVHTGKAMDDMQGVSPLRDLVHRQLQALARRQTLIEPPRLALAADALPDEPLIGGCWHESRIQIEALPSILLILDTMSGDPSIDISQANPLFRPVLVEAVLSPDRIEQCLQRIGTPFATDLAARSLFLTESRRNQDFARFLLRNLPGFQMDVMGVSLRSDRYIQLPSGEKLREGAAPDLYSRIAAIGDRGLLMRTAQGWQVLFWPLNLRWRLG